MLTVNVFNALFRLMSELSIRRAMYLKAALDGLEELSGQRFESLLALEMGNYVEVCRMRNATASNRGEV